MRHQVRKLVPVVLLSLASTLSAAEPKKPATKPTSKPAGDERTVAMDYGPFLSTSVLKPAGKPYKPVPPKDPTTGKLPIDPIVEPVVLKGIVIPVGPKAAVAFDTDTCSLVSGWTGGWLDLSGTMLTNHKGTSQVTMPGTEQFHVDGPGWGAGKTGDDFSDPRIGNPGPLPADRARYQGLYVNGNQVVLSYRIGSAEVLEVDGFDESVGLFTRTIRINKLATPLALRVATDHDGESTIEPGCTIATLPGGRAAGELLRAAIVGKPGTAQFEKGSHDLRIKLAPSDSPVLLQVLVGRISTEILKQHQTGSKQPIDPTTLVTGGPARIKSVQTVGVLGNEKPEGKKPAPSYVVDTLTLPDDNPSKSWLRTTGVDFFSDGRIAICTIDGDVWIVSGVDDKLDKLTWTRFAAGLYHPMGLRILDDVVYVRGRDQITRLHDLNKDGQADFYENFDNEGMAHPSYHGFVFDLQTDKEGNFYYARGGIGMSPELIGHGRLTKLSKDGKTATTLATGLRAPNGMGASPNGWITVSDNQGNWIPSSKIHIVDPSAPLTQPSFFGFMPAHHLPMMPTDAAPPLVWIPHKLDNSSGGQAFIDSKKWGPYEGQWVHTSFGAACLTLLLPDASSGKELPKQGAVVRLPMDFPTGVMRARFSPTDGQLYTTGVGGGWQTKGTRDGGLYRVRYTGEPAVVPSRFAVTSEGIQLTFPVPLDKKDAADPQAFGIEQWNYKWTATYGSPDLSAKTPGKAGHDTVEVKKVELSADGKTATIHLAELIPVNQMLIQVNTRAADGSDVICDVYATINEVPKK